MSDLISRSALIKRFEGLRDEHETHSISYNALYEVLVQQPTAYDVEKVVEELKNTHCEWIGRHYFEDGIEAAIDIVKAGGVK